MFVFRLLEVNIHYFISVYLRNLAFYTKNHKRSSEELPICGFLLFVFYSLSLLTEFSNTIETIAHINPAAGQTIQVICQFIVKKLHVR